MTTAWDWIALILFAALVALFLQRSAESAPRRGDTMPRYLVAAIALAGANQAGNHGHPAVAILLFAIAVAWVLVLLGPFATR